MHCSHPLGSNSDVAYLLAIIFGGISKLYIYIYVLIHLSYYLATSLLLLIILIAVLVINKQKKKRVMVTPTVNEDYIELSFFNKDECNEISKFN